MPKCNIIILLVFGLVDALFAQQVVKGTVTDETNDKPLGYCNIILKHTSIGTMSNDEGDFYLVLPRLTDDTIVVSYLGYYTQYIPISEIIKTGLTIKLRQQIQNINEILIKPIDPYELLEEVLANMDKNYYQLPYNSDGFYREICFENEQPVKLSESVCHFYFSPYSEPFDFSKSLDAYLDFSAYSNKYEVVQPLNYYNNATYPSDQVKIVQSRSSDNFSGAISKYGIMGGPLNITAVDFLRSKSLQLSAKNRKLYKKQKGFKLSCSYQFNDKTILTILKIYSLTNGEWIELTIDESTMSVLSYRGKKVLNWTERFLRTHHTKGKRINYYDLLTQNGMIYQVDFKKIGRYWYQHHIKTTSYFTYQYVKEHVTLNLNYDRELILNNYTLDSVKQIPEDEQFKNIISNNLYDLPSSYNSEFWSNYNQIYPTRLQRDVLNKMEAGTTLETQFQSAFISIDSLKKPELKVFNGFKTFYHDTLLDSYSWDKVDTVMLNYIEKENRYAQSYMHQFDDPIRTIYNEIISYIPKSSHKQLSFRLAQAYYFFNKRNSLCKSETANGKDSIVVINFEEKLKQNINYLLMDYHFDTINNLFVYWELPDGRRNSNIVIFDLIQSKELAVLENALQMEWINSSQLVYSKYISGDFFTRALFFYDIVSKNDSLIYSAHEKSAKLEIRTSASNEYIFVEDISYSKFNQIHFINKKNSIGVQNIELFNDTVSQYFEHYNNHFFLLTNAYSNQFEIFKFPNVTDSKIELSKLVSYSNDTIIKNISFVENHMVFTFQYGVTSNIGLIKLSDNSFSSISFVVEPYYTLTYNKSKSKDNLIYFNYSSYIKPTEYWTYCIDTRVVKCLSKDTIPNYNEKEYKSDLEWISNKDGIKIPFVSIRNVKTKKEAPFLLDIYAQGSADGFLPNFSSWLLPTLDRGFVVAYPLVRGSGEMGYNWSHLADNQNRSVTFDDLETVIQSLFKKKVVDSERLFLSGTSAGGLAVAVLLNRHPDWFKGVILNVPEVNILLTENEQISLNKNVYGDWSHKKVLDQIKSYDPYLNISDKKYSNILIFSAFSDENVPIEDVTRYVGKLRKFQKEDNLILYRAHMNEDHDGGTYGFYHKLALMNVFMLNLLD